MSTGATDTNSQPDYVALAIGQKRNSMDIVYLVKECKENKELTYSLRSLVNLPHNRVFIVGGCPNNLNKSKLIHTAILQTKSKYQNTTTNLQLICQNKALSDNFILMNDDFFILEPIKNPVQELNLCRGPIEEVIKDYARRYNNCYNDYLLGMKQTKIFLQDMCIANPLSYELHIPMILNKQKVLDMFKLPHLESVKVIHKRSLYGNLYMKDSTPINDVKVLKNYYYPLGSNKFLSTEDDSFERVHPFLNNLFPDKGYYEL